MYSLLSREVLGRWFVLSINVKNIDDVNIKYVYYYLKYKEKDTIAYFVSRGSIPALNKVDIDNYLIHLQPITTQLKL